MKSATTSEILGRLAFSRKRVQEIREITDDFLGKAIQQKHDLNLDGSRDIYLSQTIPVPAELTIGLGEVVHTIRACLDSLACQLADRNGKLSREVSFPISVSKEAHQSAGMKKLKNLSINDQEKISALEPFKNGDDLLFGLHKLDIQEKHLRLAVNAVAPRDIRIVIPGTNIGLLNASNANVVFSGQFNGRPTGDVEFSVRGSLLREIGKEYIIGKNMNVDIEVTSNLVFLEPDCVADKNCIAFLEASLERVVYIVEQF